MASGIDKSKLYQARVNRRGYHSAPAYMRGYVPTTKKQGDYLTDLWAQLREAGCEYDYDKRALVEARVCSREINHAYSIAKRMGIELKGRRAND